MMNSIHGFFSRNRITRFVTQECWEYSKDGGILEIFFFSPFFDTKKIIKEDEEDKGGSKA